MAAFMYAQLLRIVEATVEHDSGIQRLAGMLSRRLAKRF